jgi:putative membrane protein
MKILGQILSSTLAIMAATYFLPHVHVDSPLYALLLAVVISALTILVKPVLIVLTLPATILTFGLFLFVINAVIVLIADYLVTGFHVEGFWWAMLFSIVVAAFNSVLESLFFNDEARKS